MSGPVLDFDPRATRRNGGAGDTRDAPGLLETITAGFEAARADTTGQPEAMQTEAYRPAIEALGELGYEWTAFVNPRRGTVSPEAVYRALNRERANGHTFDMPDTIEEFEKQWRARERERIQGAEETAGRGNLVAGFAGGMAGAMTDPINLFSLPIGGFGATVGKRVLTEGLVNAGVELFQQPGIQRARDELGRRDLTAAEVAQNVAFAGVGAAALRGGIEVAPVAAKRLAKTFREKVPNSQASDLELAALSAVDRAEQIAEASPFVAGEGAQAAHVSKLQAAMNAIEEGRLPTSGEIAGAIETAAPRVIGQAAGEIDRQAIKAAIRGPESGGDDLADNALGSSAAGRYQFIEATFTDLYRLEYRVSAGEAQNAWNTNRYDVGVQERLMDRLLDENAGALARAGFAADPGNLYLAHFAGYGKAVELLEADKSLPVSAFFGKRAIRQNPTYLGGGKTVGESIDIIRGKVGDPAEPTPARVVDEPELRDLEPIEARPVVPPRQLDLFGDGAKREAIDATELEAELGAKFEGDTAVQSVPALEPGVGSWIIRAKDTGRAVLETTSERVARAIDQVKFEVLTAKQHLARLNQEIAESATARPVQTKLEADGWTRKGRRFTRRIEDFAESGTVSSGARKVTLRLDPSERYLERFDPGLGEVVNDVDLRRFDNPEAAIRQVLAERDAEPFSGPLPSRAPSPVSEPSPRGSDAGAAARARSDHSDLPPEPDARFAEGDSEGIRAAAESVWHDIREARDDAPSIDLGDGRGARSAAEIREELDQETAGIEAMRSCLK